MEDVQESFYQKRIKITLVVLLYWFVSITLVFVNKTLLSDVENTIDAPLFITWFQCLVSVGMCVLLRYTSKYCPHQVTFEDLTIDFNVLRKILPLSSIFVSMISFNNLCLKHVGVPFYFIGRSLTTVFNVILSYVLLGQKTSFPVLVSCGVVVIGFLLGVDQEGLSGNFSVVGVGFGALSSLFVCLNSIFVKRTLPVVHDNIWKLTYYNNVNAIVIFLPFMLVAGEFRELLTFSNAGNPVFWSLMLVGGVFGFSIGYVSGLQIKVTSPLTHNISANAKACLQTVIGCVMYQEVKSVLWWLSNLVLLAGSMMYSLIRQKEMKKEMLEAKSQTNA